MDIKQKRGSIVFGIGPAEALLISVILFICILPIFLISKILKKAGFSGWYSLISLIPVANIICLWVFAFVPWANDR